MNHVTSPEPEAPASPIAPASSARNELLFSALYDELRRLAQRQLSRNAGAHISPTTLLHEAYIGMSRRELLFPDRQHFLGYAARVMRGLIIDLIRERRALKRGAQFQFTELPADIAQSDETELVKLSEALDELAVDDPRLAELVDLRYFCGFTVEEVASQRGVTSRTVSRDWEKAKAILFRKLKA